MPINPQAVGATSEPFERSWASTDCLLYALGVGAGSRDPSFELEFTSENSTGIDQRVLPTFATIVGTGGSMRADLGTYDPAMLVHGEQGIELLGPIPVSGTVTTTSTVKAIYDKGSGAVVVLEAISLDASTGEKRFSTTSSLFIRGEGGFGGERGLSTGADPLPDREPDEVVTYHTRPDQALLYRLSGDRNPLHSDPAFAKRGGFDLPILHGLCTYGFTGRALLHSLCGSNPLRFGSMHCRFSRPTIPGDTLTISVWMDQSQSSARFRTTTQRGEIVIDAGTFTFSGSK